MARLTSMQDLAVLRDEIKAKKDVTAKEVAICTGITTGDMFEWQDVNPGADGTIQIICSVYTGAVPGGSSSGQGAYAPTALRVQEAVLTPPAIVVQPQSVAVNTNETATFSVGATGTGLSYPRAHSCCRPPSRHSRCWRT